MHRITLSYSLTLPQSIYPHLDYLISINKRVIKSWISDLWNNETLNKLKQTGKALSILKKEVKNQEKGIPSRVYRNSLELAGQILRSQIERKEVYEFIANHPCTTFWNENYLADYLQKSPLFILNVQRQIRKQFKKGYIEKDYLKVAKPKFNADIFITSADDSIENGQFKKLQFYKKNGLWFMKLNIKLPTTNKQFKWFEIKKLVPDKVARLLTKGAKPQAPLIKKESLANGYSIYRLVIPFEIEVNEPDINHIEEYRVLSIDLSPSENRLAVATVVEEEGHSKPVFFKAKRIIRKIDRIQKEIDNLEKKIDHVANDIHTTTSKNHKEKLQNRLRHLYQEQKRKQMKIKQIREEMLNVFTNWVIEYAESYNVKVLAIEKLRFKETPNWQSSKAIKRFIEWFYRKIRDKLQYKAKLRGIRVLEIEPAYTSQYCHKCNKKAETDKLTIKCECGRYDRDYNASVKIIKAGKTKSGKYDSKDTPARVPFRQGLASFTSLISVLPLTRLVAYSGIVESSALKLKRLHEWIDTRSYGYG